MNFECLKSQYNSSQLYILNVRDVKFLFGGDLQLNNLLHYLPNIPVPKSDQEIESDLKKKKLKLSKTLSKFPRRRARREPAPKECVRASQMVINLKPCAGSLRHR